MRVASSCIRSVHRKEEEKARELLTEAGELTSQMITAFSDHPRLRFGGFVGDAEKEYAEAATTYALINGEVLPTPDELKIDYAPWLNGLAEAGGELRRHVLDLVREGQPEKAEQFLDAMEEIYRTIMGFDYPNAISYGLRQRSDALRGMVERTRGDLTNALRQAHLEQLLADFEQKLPQ